MVVFLTHGFVILRKAWLKIIAIQNGHDGDGKMLGAPAAHSYRHARCKDLMKMESQSIYM